MLQLFLVWISREKYTYRFYLNIKYKFLTHENCCSMYYIFSYALNKNLTSWEYHEENSQEIR